jgi:hypothetical protein
VRYGVEPVHQPTPDPPQPSIDHFLPQESIPAECGDGGRFVTDVVEEVEEVESEESIYLKQQLANLVCKKFFFCLIFERGNFKYVSNVVG